MPLNPEQDQTEQNRHAPELPIDPSQWADEFNKELIRVLLEVAGNTEILGQAIRDYLHDQLQYKQPPVEKELIGIADILFHPDTNRILMINNFICTQLRQFIEEAEKNKQPDRVAQLKSYQKILADLLFHYYLMIDGLIDVKKLESLRQEVVQELNEYEGKPREQTMINLGGHSGAGKNTTLGQLGLEAFETGTAGVVGRAKGFEHWEEVIQSWDLPGADQHYIPDKVVTLILLLGLRAQRQRLDRQGKPHTPVVISGYPRTVDQARCLQGIHNIESVYLAMTPEEAKKRTINRIIEFLCSENGTAREDDVASLENFDLEHFKGLLKEKLGENEKPSREEILEFLQDETVAAYLAQVQISAGSRFMRDLRTQDRMIEALKFIDVETTVIPVSGKTPEEVTAETRAALHLEQSKS